jgi:hypothetical protein
VVTAPSKLTPLIDSQEPLHRTTLDGHLGVVKMLLDNDADVASTTPPTAISGSAAVLQTSTEPASSERRPLQHREVSKPATAATPAPSYPSLYPSAQSFGYRPDSPSIPSSTTVPVEPQLNYGDISPRAAKKTKARVASACVNCKKRHLSCDDSRPCRRCVQSGKEVC